ncbi:GlxA family transcriptional regulator [Chitinophaga varians]|uniref:GlxA family transcriptional regulator n=1 Tax=Chitinophaga varians TaxID=2202339 RepID=UPI00165EFC1C|nr:helix-turn-helix domain-containing protein [Chitinophaga varians]MBC9909564.1 helix-turn-helix domain-containing protein [Chitinophaga varians]
MKHVSIVIPLGAAMTGIEVARHVFTEVNDFLISEGREPLFQVQLVGAWRAIQLNKGLFTIQTDAVVQELHRTDLIIIPALHENVEENVARNGELVDWIRAQYEKGAEVASLCVGAFLLAQTGLLIGKKCTTHWKAAALFRDMFPDVQLVKEKVITDENGIYSSGGGLSLVNLLVYLVEKYAGRDAAIYSAKFFQVDLERSAQLPFIIFQAQKEHDDEPVKQAQEFIENNFREKIRVDELAEMLAIGRRSLERRFKKATANTMNEYIQRVKIEAAKKHLEAGDRKINDIMSEVGYSDTKTFRNSFKLVTGLLPHEYRNRYNKKMAEI